MFMTEENIETSFVPKGSMFTATLPESEINTRIKPKQLSVNVAVPPKVGKSLFFLCVLMITALVATGFIALKVASVIFS